MPNVTRKPRLTVGGVVRKLFEPRVAYGPHPFSHKRDDADGVRIAGWRLVRGEDGLLYGVPDTNDDEPPEAA